MFHHVLVECAVEEQDYRATWRMPDPTDETTCAACGGAITLAGDESHRVTRTAPDEPES